MLDKQDSSKPQHEGSHDLVDAPLAPPEAEGIRCDAFGTSFEALDMKILEKRLLSQPSLEKKKRQIQGAHWLLIGLVLVTFLVLEKTWSSSRLDSTPAMAMEWGYLSLVWMALSFVLLLLYRNLSSEQDQLRKRGVQAYMELVETLEQNKFELTQLMHDQLELKHRAEEQVLQRGASVDAMLNMLEDLKIERDRAERANRVKSDFLGVVSHELRTPMNAVLGFCECLKETEMNPEQAEMLQHMDDAGRHMMSMVQKVLDVVSLEQGSLVLQQEPFLWAPVLERLQARFGALCAEKSLSFRVEAGIKHCLRGDASRLSQVLAELLDNALNHTSRGEIVLSLREESIEGLEDQRVRIHFEVCDTGEGIEQAEVEHLFQALTQKDESSTRKHGGLGIGLSLCAGILKSMGSQLRVESTLGKGSRFYFDLEFELVSRATSESEDAPSGKVLESTETAHVSSAPSEPLSVQSSASVDSSSQESKSAEFKPQATILIVDDSKMNLKVIKKVLEKCLKHRGVEILLANGGAAAVELMLERSVDLIFMDLSMPEMDGIEASRQILSHQPSTKIIALTANDTESDRQRAKEVGMLGYLLKPVNKEELRKRLDDHLALGDG